MRPIAGTFVVLLAAMPLAAQTPDPAVGRLQAPSAVQQRTVTDPRDNDSLVQALEKKIRCTCGCNLDVFTCRTTDFTCQTSPAMHREVLSRLESQSTEQVIASFVAQYGQSILMQPPKQGFNWAAYLMPFVGLALGLGLVGAFMRKWVRAAARSRPGVPGADEGGPTVPGATADEMERLKRELERFEA